MRNSHVLLEMLSQLESLDSSFIERMNRNGGLEIASLLEIVSKPTDHTVDFPDTIEPIHFNEIDEEVTSETSYCLVALDCEVQFDRLKLSTSKEKWLIVEPSLLERTKTSLIENGMSDVIVVPCFESFVMTPHNQLLLRDGEPVFHPCGTGDTFSALRAHGVLEDFVSRGGTHIIVDCGKKTEMIGRHVVDFAVKSTSPIVCEVDSDSPTGEFLCRHKGIDRAVDERIISWETPREQFKWRATGNYVVRADLDFQNMQLPWHRTRKVIKGSITVRYERFLSDMTAHFQTKFISA